MRGQLACVTAGRGTFIGFPVALWYRSTAGRRFRVPTGTDRPPLPFLALRYALAGPQDGHIRVGKLNLVDLAGSERQSKTGATGGARDAGGAARPRRARGAGRAPAELGHPALGAGRAVGIAQIDYMARARARVHACSLSSSLCARARVCVCVCVCLSLSVSCSHTHTHTHTHTQHKHKHAHPPSQATASRRPPRSTCPCLRRAAAGRPPRPHPWPARGCAPLFCAQHKRRARWRGAACARRRGPCCWPGHACAPVLSSRCSNHHHGASQQHVGAPSPPALALEAPRPCAPAVGDHIHA